LQQKDKFGCGNFTVVGPATQAKVGRLAYSRLLCNAYRCSRCRPRKLRRVRARIAEIATQTKLQRFVTLTLDPKKIPENVTSDRHLRETWRKMRVLLARKFKASMPFISVLEFHKSGIAHLHILVGIYIPQSWLSEAWQSVGGGKIVDIRYVDVHRVSAYLTKYLANQKVEHTLRYLPLRARIFSTSRSIVFWGKNKSGYWWLAKKNFDRLREMAEKVSNERFEALADYAPFDLSLLMYFESALVPEAVKGIDVFRVMKALIHRDSMGKQASEQSCQIQEFL